MCALLLLMLLLLMMMVVLLLMLLLLLLVEFKHCERERCGIACDRTRSSASMFSPPILTQRANKHCARTQDDATHTCLRWLMLDHSVFLGG